MGCQQICLDFCNVLKVIRHGRQGSAITRISFNICIPLHIVVCKQHTEKILGGPVSGSCRLNLLKRT